MKAIFVLCDRRPNCKVALGTVIASPSALMISDVYSIMVPGGGDLELVFTLNEDEKNEESDETIRQWVDELIQENTEFLTNG